MTRSVVINRSIETDQIFAAKPSDLQVAEMVSTTIYFADWIYYKSQGISSWLLVIFPFREKQHVYLPEVLLEYYNPYFFESVNGGRALHLMIHQSITSNQPVSKSSQRNSPSGERPAIENHLRPLLLGHTTC